MAPFHRPYDFLLVRHCKHKNIYLVPFLSYLTLNNIMTLKSGLEITQLIRTSFLPSFLQNAWPSEDRSADLVWPRVIRTGTIQILGCGFLFVFHSSYGSILHQFRDKARFFIPPLHSTPALGGGSRQSIAIPFGVEKLEWWVYPMGKKSDHAITRFDRIHERDTRARTHTHRITTQAALMHSIAGQKRRRRRTVREEIGVE